MKVENIQVSQEENVCKYLWVLLVNSAFDPATWPGSYLIYSLLRTMVRFYDTHIKLLTLLWENVWSDTLFHLLFEACASKVKVLNGEELHRLFHSSLVGFLLLSKTSIKTSSTSKSQKKMNKVTFFHTEDVLHAQICFDALALATAFSKGVMLVVCFVVVWPPNPFLSTGYIKNT